jgi:prepilin-type N-terminal cleavage/methylation domain-containing protein
VPYADLIVTRARIAPSSRLKRGFTLIELLAVLGVVGLLATILVPVIQDSIERSRQVKTLNNMRQIGSMVSLFSADSRGALPCAWNSTANQSWTQQFDQAGLLDPESNRDALVCPLMEAQYGNENEESITSYSMNNNLGDRPKAAWEGINFITEATDPSRTALLFNSFYTPGSYHWKSSATSNPGYNTIIPADGVNVLVLYLDNSVRPLLATERRLISSGSRGSDEWLFWKGTRR